MFVYVTYDTQFQTWNVVNETNNCLFYGSVDEVDRFLQRNIDKYQEG